jgi:hypothetical protein
MNNEIKKEIDSIDAIPCAKCQFWYSNEKLSLNVGQCQKHNGLATNFDDYCSLGKLNPLIDFVKRLEDLLIENNIHWCAFILYLKREYNEGKIDFHLRIQGNSTFYIHPQGKDGQTFDGKF